MIAGFILTGDHSTNVIVRAIDPSPLKLTFLSRRRIRNPNSAMETAY